jgi:hypothetical protein
VNLRAADSCAPRLRARIVATYSSVQEGAEVVTHVRFGSKADMCSAKGHVCFVPIAVIAPIYSITSSAATCRVCGIASPKCFGGFEVYNEFKLGRL